MSNEEMDRLTTNDPLNPACEICADCRYMLPVPVMDKGVHLKGVHPCAKTEKLVDVRQRACFMAEPKLKNQWKTDEQKDKF